MKVRIKYDKDEAAVPVPRVLVKADTSVMSSEEMLECLKRQTQGYMAHIWETCYIVTSLWRKGDWVHQLKEGERETRDAFARYVRDKIQRDYSAAQINTFIYVYTAYTSFGPPTADRAAEIIMDEFTGLSKLEIALPWVTAENVIELLKLAAITPARDLDEVLQAKWPKERKNRGKPDEQEIRFTAFKKYIAQDVNFVYNRMFVPRHEEREHHVERAYMMVTRKCMEKLNISSDVAFEEMLKLWVNNVLTARELEALRQSWADGNSNADDSIDWPMQNKQSLKRAA